MTTAHLSDQTSHVPIAMQSDIFAEMSQKFQVVGTGMSITMLCNSVKCLGNRLFRNIKGIIRHRQHPN